MARRNIDAERLEDIGDLRAFCLVVDLGSITHAAKRLGETKGSVSRRLTRLEREVGSVLVRRTPRLVQATEVGTEFRERVGRAIELLDEAAAHVRGTGDAPRGHLRVTAPTDIALAVLGPVVASFTRAFPEVTVEVLLTERMLDFDRDEIDVALRASTRLEDSSLVAHRIRDVEIGFYASPSYRDEHGLPSRPDQLEKHALVLVGARRGTMTVDLARTQGERATATVRASITASDYAFARAAALAGGGLALLPSNIAEADVATGALVPALRGYTARAASIYLVHRGTRSLTAKVRAFREHVLAEAARRRRRA